MTDSKSIVNISTFPNALILQINGLENEKTGQILFEESLSGGMPFSGQLSNQFLEGMRQIYELEPFIKIGISTPGEAPRVLCSA